MLVTVVALDSTEHIVKIVSMQIVSIQYSTQIKYCANMNSSWVVQCRFFYCPDIDDCAGGPCVNGGVCLDIVSGYVCNCSETGFQGTFCEISNYLSLPMSTTIFKQK